MDLELGKRPGFIRESMLLTRVDFSPPHRPPSAARLAVVAIAAIAGSLLADALLVVIGESIFPSTKGYPHFQFPDYAKLTVIGVIVACCAWPVVSCGPLTSGSCTRASLPGPWWCSSSCTWLLLWSRTTSWCAWHHRARVRRSGTVYSGKRAWVGAPGLAHSVQR